MDREHDQLNALKELVIKIFPTTIYGIALTKALSVPVGGPDNSFSIES